MDVKLPKLWQGRIKKYWDKTLPGYIPASASKFSLKFSTAEDKAAVEKFEAELGTGESVVNNLLPVGTFTSGYLGVYDVTGPTGELILLNPEKVNSKDNFLVLHYTNGEWETIQDVQLIDGYIWGTVTSDEETGLSPVAVVFYKYEMQIVELDYYANKLLVGNGNPIKITTNDEDKIIVTNLNSGKVINITDEGINNVAAGCANDVDLDSTSIAVEGVNNDKLNVYAGSFYYDENYGNTNIKEANISVVNSTVRAISNCYGMVRTEVLNINVENSTGYFVAAGQSTISKIGKDANKSLEEISLASAEWVKKCNINFVNSKVEWFYTGGSSGYSYTVDADVKIINSNVTGGLVAGGSNGRSDNVNLYIENSVMPSYLSVNRGIIQNVNMKIKSSKIDLVSPFSDTADDGTGTIVGSVAIDIDDGTYTIITGKNGNKPVDSDDVNNVLKYVKISRSADYTISNEDLAILGDKFIVK